MFITQSSNTFPHKRLFRSCPRNSAAEVATIWTVQQLHVWLAILVFEDRSCKLHTFQKLKDRVNSVRYAIAQIVITIGSRDHKHSNSYVPYHTCLSVLHLDLISSSCSTANAGCRKIVWSKYTTLFFRLHCLSFIKVQLYFPNAYQKC